MRLQSVPALLLGLAACAPKSETAQPAAPQEAVFTAKDFTFSGPDSIAPGFTAIRFVNAGTQDHHLIFGKLDEGKTLQDVMAYLKEHPTAVPAYLTWHGAGNAIAPGGSTGSTVDLPAGHYILICFLPDPADGKPHVMKGMMKELVVAGPPGAAKAPMAHGEIRLKDFAFDAPALSAGTHTFHVVNDGPQVHEVQLVRLNDGATIKDFMAAMAPGAKGPPPGVLMGGPGAYSAGLDSYWTVTFTPGNYAFVCFVPDSADGVPHMMKGMVREFTVSPS